MTDKLTETVEREPVTAVSAEMARIRGLFDKGGDGDREDLITYAKEIVKLRAALHPIDEGVTQADRDAAARHIPCNTIAEGLLLANVREGKLDCHQLVQDFRAHRVAALRGSQS